MIKTKGANYSTNLTLLMEAPNQSSKGNETEILARKENRQNPVHVTRTLQSVNSTPNKLRLVVRRLLGNY